MKIEDSVAFPDKFQEAQLTLAEYGKAIDKCNIADGDNHIDFDKLHSHPLTKELIKNLKKIGISKRELKERFWIAYMLIGSLM